MEFKGTKGKWIVNSSSDYTGEYSLRTDLYSPTFEEDEYNALLISKAPEMLEMLGKCRDIFLDLKHDKNLPELQEIQYEIEQLIKQATEL